MSQMSRFPILLLRIFSVVLDIRSFPPVQPLEGKVNPPNSISEQTVELTGKIKATVCHQLLILERFLTSLILSVWAWYVKVWDGKESACNAGDMCWIPGSGRSPGEGNGYPLQYSSLENSIDRGAWWATLHGVAELNTTQSNETLGKESEPPWIITFSSRTILNQKEVIEWRIFILVMK